MVVYLVFFLFSKLTLDTQTVINVDKHVSVLTLNLINVVDSGICVKFKEMLYYHIYLALQICL